MADEKTTPETPAAPQLTAEQIREIASRYLNEAPPEEILRNTRMGGIVGQRMQAARADERKELEEKLSVKARREAAEENVRLANDDPAEFSRRYLSDYEKEQTYARQAELADSIEKEFAEHIGKAFTEMGELQDLKPEEFTRLQTALQGKKGKEVLGAFATTAADIIADRKATRRLEEFRAKELPKEREAAKIEQAARNLQESDRPDLTRTGANRSSFDPTKLDDKAFDKFYREQFLGRV